MAAFEAGQIVIADWRDAIPREPNKLRPAVAIEDTALFDSLYPDVILFRYKTERTSCLRAFQSRSSRHPKMAAANPAGPSPIS